MFLRQDIEGLKDSGASASSRRRSLFNSGTLRTEKDGPKGRVRGGGGAELLFTSAALSAGPRRRATHFGGETPLQREPMVDPTSRSANQPRAPLYRVCLNTPLRVTQLTTGCRSQGQKDYDDGAHYGPQNHPSCYFAEVLLNVLQV